MQNASSGDVVGKMREHLKELKACKPFTPDERGNLRRDGKPLPKVKGVYCFYEGDKPVYVGMPQNIRARNNIRDCVLGHRRPRGDKSTAPFAFELARKEFKKRRTDADVVPMRMDELPENSEFNRIFTKAKARVRKMSVRFVEIENPVEQAKFVNYARAKWVRLRKSIFLIYASI